MEEKGKESEKDKRQQRIGSKGANVRETQVEGSRQVRPDSVSKYLLSLGVVEGRRRVAIRRGPMRQLAKHIIFVKGLLCWRVIKSLPLDDVIVRLIILVIIGEREGFGGIQGDGNGDRDRQGGGQGVLNTDGRRQSRRLARLYRVHGNMKLGG